MNRKKQRGLFLLCFLLSVVLLLSKRGDIHTLKAQTIDNYRVLFISSYSYTWSTVPLQMEGIQSVLGNDVTLDVEFMDTKVLSEELAQKQLLE